MNLKTYFSQVIEWSDVDLGAAQITRGVTKWFFDLLRNVMILGLIKYLADRTDSIMLEGLYRLGAAALVVYMFSYIHTWRLRPFPFLGDGWKAKLLNAAVGGAVVGLFFLLVMLPVSFAIDEISKAQQ